MATSLGPVQDLLMKGTNCIAIGTSGNRGFYYSSDSGNNWVVSNITTDYRNASFNSTWIAMDGPNAIAIGESYCYYSNNYGHTWTQSNLSGTPHMSTVCLSGQYALLGSYDTENPLYYSNNYGQTWSPSTGNVGHTIYSTQIDLLTGNSLIFTGSGVYYSTNYGATFLNESTYPSDITGNYCQYSQMVSNYVVTSMNGAGIMYSSDYGRTFAIGLAAAYTGWSFPDNISMDNSGNCIYISQQYYTLWYSRNYGQTWTLNSSSTVVDRYALSISGNYAVCVGNKYSTNYGESWNNSTPALYALQGCISNVGPNVIVSTDTNVYYSINGGQNYTIATKVPINIITTVISGVITSASYFTGDTNLIIPITVTSIADNALKNFTPLTSVTIPSSVTSIGASAFQGCTSLVSVTLQRTSTQGLTTLGKDCFLNAPLSSESVLNLYTMGYTRYDLIKSGIPTNIVDQIISNTDGVVDITVYYYYSNYFG
jgi:hypothetical protein